MAQSQLYEINFTVYESKQMLEAQLETGSIRLKSLLLVVSLLELQFACSQFDKKQYPNSISFSSSSTFVNEAGVGLWNE